MGGVARGPGPRSLEMLGWVDRVEVADLEALGLAVGVGRSALYSHAGRLEVAGLVERVPDREGSVLLITPAGRRLVGKDLGRVGPGLGSLFGRTHGRAVSWVAAHATLKGRDWVSDREARTRPEWLVPLLWTGGRRSHRPDLGVVLAGGRIAVEVELSRKSSQRLRAILAGYAAELLAGRLSGVLYFSDRPDVLRRVQQEAGAVGVPAWGLRTRGLEEIKTEVRDLAGRSPSGSAVTV